MKKVLFVNTRKAKCSIYESGVMSYTALKKYSENFFDYIEIHPAGNFSLPSGFDVYLFNYHQDVMYWLDLQSVKNINALKITLVLEMLPDDALVMCEDGIFDIYMVLDPTFKPKGNNQYAFPRPLEECIPSKKYTSINAPVIGSFGFATPGKGFDRVVDAVNKEFDKAVVRLNIPHGDFVPNSRQRAGDMVAQCRSMAKPGIKIIATHDYLSKQELVNWCASNSLNCFLYDRKVMPGLAATIDQAILACKPIAISDNTTFRHVHQYLQPYPQWNLHDSIKNSLAMVEKMAVDWHPKVFAKKFDAMLDTYDVKECHLEKNQSDVYALSRKKDNVRLLFNINNTAYTVDL